MCAFSGCFYIVCEALFPFDSFLTCYWLISKAPSAVSFQYSRHASLKALTYTTRSSDSTFSASAPSSLDKHHGSLRASSSSNSGISRVTDSLKGDFCLAIVALFLPPLAVLKKTGCDHHFLISIILTFLGWTPGILYAWYIILLFPEGKRAARYEYRMYSDELGNYYHPSHRETRYRY